LPAAGSNSQVLIEIAAKENSTPIDTFVGKFQEAGSKIDAISKQSSGFGDSLSKSLVSSKASMEALTTGAGALGSAFSSMATGGAALVGS